MNLELKKFVLIVDNTIPKEVCEKLIVKFNELEDIHQKIDNNGTPNFTQLNITKYKDVFGDELHSELESYILNAVKLYYDNIPETFFWKHGFTYEQLRIKRYNNNNHDQFGSHIDAVSSDTAKRFLAFFWYLNDVEEGGETEFFNIGLKVKPKAGKLVMFPPLWLFPHKGNKPISNEKYLLSSYLHFK